MLKQFLWLAVGLLFSTLVAAQDWMIDVRTPAEVKGGMVENAVNIEFQDIVEGVKALNVSKDDTIYVYCRSGNRAGKALSALHGAGYHHVKNLGSYETAKRWYASQPKVEAVAAAE